MTAVTRMIREKGYWRIRIRPADYDGERIDYAGLPSILDRTRVSIRGWEFPHRDYSLSDTLHGDRWIGSDLATKSRYRYEAWRFYQSGQFIVLRGIWTDYVEPVEGLGYSRQFPPPDSAVLPIGETVFMFTEAFEFASRLALTEAGSDSMVVEFNLRGAEGRFLWVDDPSRWGMDDQKTFHEPELSLRRVLPRSVLAGEAWDLALQTALQVYTRFGWNPPREIVEGQQVKLRQA